MLLSMTAMGVLRIATSVAAVSVHAMVVFLLDDEVNNRHVFSNHLNEEHQPRLATEGTDVTATQG